MNILTIGERQFLHSYQAQDLIHSNITDFQEDWRVLLDPVKCEEILDDLDGIIHTGVCNYQSTKLSYKEILLPLQSIIDHVIQTGLPIVYVSDSAAIHKSPRDTSQEYFHHLAEREVHRANLEDGKGWIIRPDLIIDEPSFSTLGIRSSEDIEYRVNLCQQILDRSIELFATQPEDTLVLLENEFFSANQIISQLGNESKSPIRKNRYRVKFENYVKH